MCKTDFFTSRQEQVENLKHFMNQEKNFLQYAEFFTLIIYNFQNALTCNTVFKKIRDIFNLKLYMHFRFWEYTGQNAKGFSNIWQTLHLSSGLMTLLGTVLAALI